LQYKNLGYSTLPSGMPNPPAYSGFFSPNTGIWVTDANNAQVDILTGIPATYKLSVPVAPLPVLSVGPNTGAQRNYVVSQNCTYPGNVNCPSASTLTYNYNAVNPCDSSPHTQTQLGEADGVEVQTYTVSSRITLGACPVYAIQTPDFRRVFVLNRGSDTVSVINSQLNTLDNQCPAGCKNQAGQTYFTHPTLPLSTASLTTSNAPVNCNIVSNPTCGMPSQAGPVYAEYNQATNQLVIADYDGGTITMIDVSLDEYGNDSQSFGTTFTISVGTNPASVTVLYDGSRAYAANQADGTVTIVNLTSHTVEKTITVNGNPRSVSSTQNSSYGKVYVASPNSPYLTIIRTDLDIVDTALLIEGNPVDVRVSNQNGVSGNAITSSRIPGAGQPCFLLGAGQTLAQCQQMP
jgi:YVTN family beta-propeller protein